MKTSTKISTHRLILPLTTFYSGQERKARKRAPAFSKVMNSVCNDIWHIVYIVAFSIVFQSCAEEATLSLSEQDVPLGKVVLEEGQVNAKMNLNRTVTVSVSDLPGLYNAVNDPENAKTIVVLAPGRYVLNSSYPNAGWIELQEDMKLQGLPGHSDQVIIDGSALPESSFTPPLNSPGPRTGAVRMGRGLNELEWMTFIGNSGAVPLSVIDTDLIWAGVSRVRIAHCIVKGGRVGINIRNVGTASNDRLIEAEILSNEVVDNLVQFGQGILAGNFRGATRAIVRAYLTGNHVHSNKVGLRAFNSSDTNLSNITIIFRADRFEENGIGMHLVGGVSQC